MMNNTEIDLLAKVQKAQMNLVRAHTALDEAQKEYKARLDAYYAATK